MKAQESSKVELEAKAWGKSSSLADHITKVIMSEDTRTGQEEKKS